MLVGKPIRCRRQFSARSLLMIAGLMTLTLTACNSSDTELVNKIRRQSQQRMTESVEQDDLGDAFSLLDRYVDLNEDSAIRQVRFHLNRWLEDNNKADQNQQSLHEGFKKLSTAIQQDDVLNRFSREDFNAKDVSHLRDCYVFSRLVRWVDSPESACEDPLLTEWLKTLQNEDRDTLVTATRLFDWCVRNIAYEPPVIGSPIQAPELPKGLIFQATGYRQTVYQTVFRGRADYVARSLAMVAMCRQANIDAAVIGVTRETGSVDPWAVGVRSGKEIYLFDFETGIFVPGPDGVGISTLAEAKRDASVLRRMKVPGFFEYPIAKSDIQSCVALVPLKPETTSDRMKRLTNSFVGDQRMVCYVDYSDLSKRLDDAKGVSDVRIWDVPLLSEIYGVAMERAADRDAQVAYYHRTKWLMLDGDIPMSKTLAQGRWRQLLGQFSDDEDNDITGAKSLYLNLRQPEFEIEDLNTDVDLQKKYAIRRNLGVAADDYDRQVKLIQEILKATKRTATFWISMIQYDDAQFDESESWLRKRVLDRNQQFIWAAHARYNLARTAEKLGKIDRAIELHKTRGAPTEHGSRIRARLLSASQDN